MPLSNQAMFWGLLVSVVVVTNFAVAVAVAVGVVAVYCGALLCLS